MTGAPERALWRPAALHGLRTPGRVFDLLVIGGGANGAGIAFDAASRGLSVALVERGDFGCGTSSRSSKLVHGGVRYLALGQWGLVREALRERARLLANAPGIVSPIRFVLPAMGQLERLQYACGLKLYDSLGGARELPPSRLLDRAELVQHAPTLQGLDAVGGVAYSDAQFDDVRLLIALLRGAAARGACVINHCAALDLCRRADGHLAGAVLRDALSGETFEVAARGVINATGAWGDALRHLDDPTSATTLLPSQGAHIVVPRHFLGDGDALVLPRTPDGRIMFVLPWHGQVLIGTTDTALAAVPDAPRPLANEIAQILDVAGRYLSPAPGMTDVLSVFAGVRPLAAVADSAASSRVSREHALDVSRSGLVSVSGGKWTTYRLIAEQTVDLACQEFALAARACTTATLALDQSDRAAIKALIADDATLARPLHAALPYIAADALWAARGEMAQSVADALAYRLRALFIDARAAAAIAPEVARIMGAELGWDADRIGREVIAARQAAADFGGEPA